jgi:hypothetical protein
MTFYKPSNFGVHMGEFISVLEVLTAAVKFASAAVVFVKLFKKPRARK